MVILESGYQVEAQRGERLVQAHPVWEWQGWSENAASWASLFFMPVFALLLSLLLEELFSCLCLAAKGWMLAL